MIKGIKTSPDGGLRNPSKLEGVYRARVEYNQDPMSQGRVRIRVPSLHGMTSNGIDMEDLPWANLVGSSAGYGYGSFMVPEVGEYVMVQFEDGDRYKPIVMGSIYGSGSKKPKEYGTGDEDDMKWESIPKISEVPEEAQRVIPTMKVLYKSPTGATIAVDESQGKEGVYLSDGLGQSISISSALISKDNKGPNAKRESEEASISIVDFAGQSISLANNSGEPSITITSDDHELKISPKNEGFIIKAKDAEIHIDKDGSTSIKSKNVNIDTNEGVEIHSQGGIEVSTPTELRVRGHAVVIGSPVNIIDPD